MRSGNNKKVTIDVEFRAQVDQMKSGISNLQKYINGINFDPTRNANFKGLFQKFENEFSKMESRLNKTGDIFDAKELSGFEGELSKVYDLYTKIVKEIAKVTGMDDDALSKLIPQDLSVGFKKASEAIKQYEKDIKNAGKTSKEYIEKQKELKAVNDKKTGLNNSRQSLTNSRTRKNVELGVRTSELEDIQKELKKTSSEIDNYEKTIEGLQQKTGNLKFVKELEEANAAIEKFEKKKSSILQDKRYKSDESRQKAIDKASKEIGGIDSQIKKRDNAQSKVDDYRNIQAINEKEAELNALIQERIELENKLQQAQDRVNKTSTEIEEQTKEIENLSNAYAQADKEAEKLENEIKEIQEKAKLEEFEKLKTKLSGFKIDGFDLKTAKNVEELKKQLESLGKDAVEKLKSQFPEIEKELDSLGITLKDTTKEINSTGNELDQLGEKSKELGEVGQSIKRFFTLANGFHLIRNAIRDAYQEIQNLDKAMTETAVVTDFDVGDMWEKLPEYTDVANKFGATIQDAYEVMTIFYQQGLETNEVFALGEQTMQMARIAGLDYANAADKMTNALRGFNMELNETSATRVNDVYSQLAAISASDTKELATAMTKVASLANSANMEFENTAAFLAQMIETTRESAETAGTALKTVVARFAEVKELYSEGQLTGQTEEGEEINVNKVGEALRTAGIDLNEFMTGAKGLDDILLELSSKWDSLDLLTQRYIATMAAGSRQQSRFLALMSDNARLTYLTGEAYNSSGASAEQFAKTQESLETKLNKLKNAWHEFILGITNSDLVKGFVDLLTKLLEGINKLTDHGDSLATTISRIALSFAAFAGGKTIIKKMIPEVGKLGKVINNVAGTKNIGGISQFAKLIKFLGTGGIKKNVSNFKNSISLAFSEFSLGWEFYKNSGKEVFKTLSESGSSSAFAIGASFRAALPYIVAISVAIIAITVVINKLINSTKRAKLKEKLEGIETTVKKLNEELENTNKQIDLLNDGWNTLNDAKTTLDGLVEGTSEWKQKLAETNLKMIELKSQLSDLNIEKNADGLFSIKEEDYEAYLESLNKKALKISAQQILADAQKQNTQDELSAENYKNKYFKTQGQYSFKTWASEENENTYKEMISENQAKKEIRNTSAIDSILATTGENYDNAISTLLSDNLDKIIEQNTPDKLKDEHYKTYAQEHGYDTYYDGTGGNSVNFYKDGEKIEVNKKAIAGELGYSKALDSITESASQLQIVIDDLNSSIGNLFSEDDNENIFSRIITGDLDLNTDDLKNFVKETKKYKKSIKDTIYKNGKISSEGKLFLANYLGISEDSIDDKYIDSYVEQIFNKLSDSAENIGRTQAKQNAETVQEFIMTGAFNNENIDLVKSLVEDLTSDEKTKALELIKTFSEEMGKEYVDGFMKAIKNKDIDTSEFINSLSSVNFNNATEGIQNLTNLISESTGELKEFYEMLLASDKFSSKTVVTQLFSGTDWEEINKELDKIYKKNHEIATEDIDDLAQSYDSLKDSLESGRISASQLSRILNTIKSENLNFSQFSEASVNAIASTETYADTVSQMNSDIQNYKEGYDSLMGIDWLKEQSDDMYSMLQNGEENNFKLRKFYNEVYKNREDLSAEEQYSILSNDIEASGYNFWNRIASKTFDGFSISIDNGQVVLDLEEGTSYLDFIEELSDKTEYTESTIRKFIASLQSMQGTVEETFNYQNLNTALNAFAESAKKVGDSIIITDEDLEILSSSFNVDIKTIKEKFEKLDGYNITFTGESNGIYDFWENGIQKDAKSIVSELQNKTDVFQEVQGNEKYIDYQTTKTNLEALGLTNVDNIIKQYIKDKSKSGIGTSSKKYVLENEIIKEEIEYVTIDTKDLGNDLEQSLKDSISSNEMSSQFTAIGQLVGNSIADTLIDRIKEIKNAWDGRKSDDETYGRKSDDKTYGNLKSNNPYVKVKDYTSNNSRIIATNKDFDIIGKFYKANKVDENVFKTTFGEDYAIDLDNAKKWRRFGTTYYGRGRDGKYDNTSYVIYSPITEDGKNSSTYYAFDPSTKKVIFRLEGSQDTLKEAIDSLKKVTEDNTEVIENNTTTTENNTTTTENNTTTTEENSNIKDQIIDGLNKTTIKNSSYLYENFYLKNKNGELYEIDYNKSKVALGDLSNKNYSINDGKESYEVYEDSKTKDLYAKIGTNYYKISKKIEKSNDDYSKALKEFNAQNGISVTNQGIIKNSMLDVISNQDKSLRLFGKILAAINGSKEAKLNSINTIEYNDKTYTYDSSRDLWSDGYGIVADKDLIQTLEKEKKEKELLLRIKKLNEIQNELKNKNTENILTINEIQQYINFLSTNQIDFKELQNILDSIDNGTCTLDNIKTQVADIEDTVEDITPENPSTIVVTDNAPSGAAPADYTKYAKVTNVGNYFGKTVNNKLGLHRGQDFEFENDEVKAMTSGQVIDIIRSSSGNNYNDGWGNQVVVLADDGRKIWYSHLDSIEVSTGENVSEDTFLGIEGETGTTSGDHTDITIGKDSTVSLSNSPINDFINPLEYFSGSKRTSFTQLSSTPSTTYGSYAAAAANQAMTETYKTSEIERIKNERESLKNELNKLDANKDKSKIDSINSKIDILNETEKILTSEIKTYQEIINNFIKTAGNQVVAGTNKKVSDYISYDSSTGNITYSSAYDSLNENQKSTVDAYASTLNSYVSQVKTAQSDQISNTQSINSANQEKAELVMSNIDKVTDYVNQAIGKAAEIAQAAIEAIKAAAQAMVDAFNSYLEMSLTKIKDEVDIEELQASLEHSQKLNEWEYEKLLKANFNYAEDYQANQANLLRNLNSQVENQLMQLQASKQLYKNSRDTLTVLSDNLQTDIIGGLEKLQSALYGVDGLFTKLDTKAQSLEKVINYIPNTINDLISRVGGDSTFLKNLFSGIDISGLLKDKNGYLGYDNLQKVIDIFKELTPTFNEEYQMVDSSELASLIQDRIGSILTLDETISGQLVSNYINYINNIYESMKEEVENLRNSQEEILEAYNTLEELLQTGSEEYSNLQKAIYDAIVSEKEVLKAELESLNENITEADSKLIDTLKSNLNLIRQQRDNDDKEKDLMDKEARLAYLKQDTSGANRQEILQLEKELEEEKRDYTDTLIDQKINELEKQNELAAEQRQIQIDLLQSEIENTEKIWEQVESIISGVSDLDYFGEIQESSYNKIIKQLKASEAYQNASEKEQKEMVESWDTMIRTSSIYRYYSDGEGENLYGSLYAAKMLLEEDTGLPEGYTSDAGWEQLVDTEALVNATKDGSDAVKKSVDNVYTELNKLVKNSSTDFSDLYKKGVNFVSALQAVSGVEYSLTKTVDSITDGLPGILEQVVTAVGEFAKAGSSFGVEGLSLNFNSGAFSYLVSGAAALASAAADAAIMGFDVFTESVEGYADIALAAINSIFESGKWKELAKENAKDLESAKAAGKQIKEAYNIYYQDYIKAIEENEDLSDTEKEMSIKFLEGFKTQMNELGSELENLTKESDLTTAIAYYKKMAYLMSESMGYEALASVNLKDTGVSFVDQQETEDTRKLLLNAFGNKLTSEQIKTLEGLKSSEGLINYLNGKLNILDLYQKDANGNKITDSKTIYDNYNTLLGNMETLRDSGEYAKQDRELINEFIDLIQERRDIYETTESVSSWWDKIKEAIKEFFEKLFGKSDNSFLSKIWNAIDQITKKFGINFGNNDDDDSENNKDNSDSGSFNVISNVLTKIVDRLKNLSDEAKNGFKQFWNSIFQHADGGQLAFTHTALTGEEGPELSLHSDGTASLLGANGPEITRVRAGDRIYTADQTRKLLSGKSFAINRYAEGTGALIAPIADLGVDYLKQNTSEINRENVFNFNLDLGNLTVDSPDRVNEVADKVWNKITTQVSSSIWPFNNL